MARHGLSADELEQLRRWGVGLGQDPRHDVSAAGRAIVLLVDEVERLAARAWDDRLYPTAPPADAYRSQADSAAELQRALKSRLDDAASAGARDDPQADHPS